MSFEGTVHNGVVVFDNGSGPPDGVRVEVIVQKSSVPQNHQPPAPVENADFDPEPPPWLDVENDIYFPITVPEKLLEIKTLIVERGTPSIILPKELPDD